MGLTNFPNGISSFGVPVVGGSSRQIFGDVYCVDGTNGSDDDPGTMDEPKATIQAAITLQTANTTGKGDVIYVMPGVYAEALTGTLTKVSLIAAGSNFGNGPNGVVVYPAAASNCFLGTTYQAEIDGFTFVQGTTTTPALLFNNMRWTTFNNNAIIGSNSSCVEAIQIGNTDAVATAANCDFNRITNNYVGTIFGTASSFTFAFKVGRVGYLNGASKKQCMSTIIENNQFFATTSGIYLGVGAGNADGTIIKRNIITSWEGGDAEGCTAACITAYAVLDGALAIKNTCATNLSAAAISNFQPGHMIDNQTTQAGVGKREAVHA